MQKTPKSLRCHIGIFGRRNVGKSSLLNAITRQNVSIVSDLAGTTTDPVEKPMELLPLGPVVFIDTAGIDDIGALGEKRIQKTKQAISQATCRESPRGHSRAAIWCCQATWIAPRKHRICFPRTSSAGSRESEERRRRVRHALVPWSRAAGKDTRLSPDRHGREHSRS